MLSCMIVLSTIQLLQCRIYYHASPVYCLLIFTNYRDATRNFIQVRPLVYHWQLGGTLRPLPPSPHVQLFKIMVRPARLLSYLWWRPWRQCILWVTAGMYASMYVYNMYSIHVTVWTRVLFYISVVKNNFLDKKKNPRSKSENSSSNVHRPQRPQKWLYQIFLKIAFLTMVWVHFLKYNLFVLNQNYYLLRDFSVNTAAVLSYI